MADARAPLFLSHSSIDKPVVRQIAEALESLHLATVWFDEQDIGVGASIRTEVAEGLTRSRALVLCMSQAALESEWVKRELAFAAARRLPIFPIEIGSVAWPANIEILLGDALRIRFDELGPEKTALKISQECDKRRTRIQGLLSDNISHPPKHMQNPGTLLTARFQVVPFVQAVRVDELALLESWWTTDEPTSVRLFLGAGGAGKTRLFMEWVKVKRPREQDIAAGFLKAYATDEDLNAIVRTLEPTLVVVDYAETRLPQLVRLLSMAAERVAGAPLRIALLARDEGDWWQNLKESDTGVQALLSEALPYRLQSTRLTIEQRRAVFNAALEAFATALGRTITTDQDIDLTDDVFDRVLYVLLAALAVTDNRSTRPGTLLNDTVAHEMRLWSADVREARHPNFKRRAGRLVGALTLRGQTSHHELASLDQNIKGPDDESFRDLLETIYRAPAQDHQRVGTIIGGLEPDLLGEALVGRVLADRETRPQFLDTVFQEASGDAISHGFTVLGRLSLWADPAVKPERWMRRFLESNLGTRVMPALRASLSLGTQTAGAPIGRLLYELLSTSSDPSIRFLAAAVDRLIPESTVSLRELAVWTTQTQLDQVSKQTDEAALNERARYANNLGLRLSDLGQREGALNATQEAVQIRRTLAKTRPDVFLPDLASSLNNLGNMLNDLGKTEDALNAAEEAVQIYRNFAQARPDEFLPDLAGSLNNLGNRLSTLGRREEALNATKEAVEIRRTLVDSRPNEFRPNLARSLNNLGGDLKELGRKEEALNATREAVKIYRILAKARPDAYLPDLAASLNNLGGDLSDLDRTKEALNATKEAVKIRRLLFRDRPDVFRPNLATTSPTGSVPSVNGKKHSLPVENQFSSTRRTFALIRRLPCRTT